MNKIYKYVFLDWVEQYLDISKWEEEEWAAICLNENAIDFILENKGKEDWYSLSINPSMIPILENNLHNLELSELSLLCEENDNLNDFSNESLYKIFDKVVHVFNNNDEYDINDDDYTINIIDNLCRRINNLSILRKYIPDLKKIGDFKFNLQGFAQNPYALPIIFENFHMVNKVDFYFNPKATKYVDIRNMNSNELYSLSFNEEMLPILKIHVNNLTSICWYNICEFKRQESIDFIEQNINKLTYESLSILCKNEYAIDLIKRNLDYMIKINDIYCDKKKKENQLYGFQIDIIRIWDYLSKNEKAIPILEKNVENINWLILSSNNNAEKLLRKYPDKICWEIASENSSLINLLRENQDKIVLKNFLKNPAIFKVKYEFDKMRDYFESTPLGHGFLSLYLNSENFENWACSVFDESDIDYHIQEYKDKYISTLDPNKNKMIQILNRNKNRNKMIQIFIMNQNNNLLEFNHNPLKKRKII